MNVEIVRSNLTFNHKHYSDYLRQTIVSHIDGDTTNDHVIRLIDYIANPLIESKSYVVIGDLISALKSIEKKDAFEKAQNKLKFMANNVYHV